MEQQKIYEQTSISLVYASADQALHDRLVTHLSQLRRDIQAEEWIHCILLPSHDNLQTLQRALRSADILLLLISANFLANGNWYHIDIRRALERYQQRDAWVFPILIRPCDWQFSPFAHLQCLPHNAKAITTWRNQDEAFLEVVQALRQIINDKKSVHTCKQSSM